MHLINTLENRKTKYKHLSSNKYEFNLDFLNKNGYVKFDKFFSDDLIENCSQEFERWVKDHSTEKIPRTKQPFIECPSTVDICLDERIISIVYQYLGFYPTIINANIKRNYPSPIPISGTQYFHRDPESKKFLKLFVYLDDVDMDTGPFTYVATSHVNRDMRLDHNERHRDDMVAFCYGNEKIKSFLGQKGTTILADTSGLHKGLLQKTKQRTMLTCYYVVNWEELYSRRHLDVELQVSKDKYNLLNNIQQSSVDLLKLV